MHFYVVPCHLYSPMMKYPSTLSLSLSLPLSLSSSLSSSSLLLLLSSLLTLLLSLSLVLLLLLPLYGRPKEWHCLWKFSQQTSYQGLHLQNAVGHINSNWLWDQLINRYRHRTDVLRQQKLVEGLKRGISWTNTSISVNWVVDKGNWCTKIRFELYV